MEREEAMSKMAMDWDEARAHLAEYKKAYESLPFGYSWFGLTVISELERRLESGERTKYLYQEIMGLE
jgi:hypothetical protein